MLEARLTTISPKALCHLLRRCSDNADISTGRDLHHYIVKNGYVLHAFLSNYLIRMYAMCGSLPEAHHVFNKLLDPNVFSWSAIISAYAKHGQHEQAIELYTQMQKSKVQPDGHAYVAALTACVSGASLDRGKLVHAQILASPYKMDLYVNNTLIDMYAKCGSLGDARQVFTELPTRNLVTWNTLIAGYVQHKCWQEAFRLFKDMQCTDFGPNQITFACVLKACASMAALIQSMLCHALVIEHGFELGTYVSNALIDMYAKCGSLRDAEALFAKLPKHDLVTWSAMIAGYVDHGLEEAAIKGYEAMQADGIKPNEITFVSILKACSSLSAFDWGRLIHVDLIERGFLPDILVNNALIGMYVNCGSFCDAKSVFEQSSKRDVVTWNSIMAGCAQHGHPHMAFQLFKQLQQEGMQPDSVTFTSIVRACSGIADVHQGKVIHVHFIESDFQQTICVMNNLIHMYIKCASLEEAHKIFDKMPKLDVVTWNAMIGGYTQYGRGEEALRLFHQMQHDGPEPNAVTIVCILKACSNTAALDNGRLIHAHVLKSNFELDAYVGSVLINLYTSCGTFEDAHSVFFGLQNKSLVPWSAMISGFAQQNNYKEALEYFEDMQRQGIEPDDVAYVSLLSACSHAGVLYEGYRQFRLMTGEHGISPNLKHYNCLVDLLGRAGHLSWAQVVLQSMPHQPDPASWTSLLSHCRTHSNVELGRRCFDHTFKLEA